MDTPRDTPIAAGKCHLEVDCAFAMDYLTILEVKQIRLHIPMHDWTNNHTLLSCQLGSSMMDKVVVSPEYSALFRANLALFDVIEQVRNGDGLVDPKHFDNLNVARHKAKQALQRAFWGSELTEVKT